MKRIIFTSILILGVIILLAKEPKDTTVVVNHEMIKRFNECDFDSTKSFNYIKDYYNSDSCTVDGLSNIINK